MRRFSTVILFGRRGFLFCFNFSWFSVGGVFFHFEHKRWGPVNVCSFNLIRLY